MYRDECQPISEAAGFQLPYKAYIVDSTGTVDEFESGAVVPFASSAVQARTAVVNQVIQAAVGRGKTIVANDCTVVGGIS